MDQREREAAMKAVAIQHESDCGMPGIFSHVADSDRAWTLVIEHYDEDRPLEKVGRPCRYTARHDWQVVRD